MTTSSVKFPHGVDYVVGGFILFVHAVAVGFAIVSVLLLLGVLDAPALMPYIVRWEAIVSFLVLVPVTGMVGITVCYHRLQTHGGFETWWPVKLFLKTCGWMALQGSDVEWIAQHRKHHQYSDHEGDPHSPEHGWLWSHAGWLFVYHTSPEKEADARKYASDILEDPVSLFVHRRYWLVPVVMAAAIGGIGYLVGGWPGVSSFLLWGYFLRVVFVWNVTWCVNSVTHIWGYRTYETRDNSRNNWIIGILAFGEGWHNNHHAKPTCARHGHAWWEIDCSYWFICFLWLCGLAWAVKSDPSNKLESS